MSPFVYLFPVEPIRVVLGLPFVLFFPGYVLIAWLFPRRESLALVERISLSIGLSLALVPLIGLALNFTPLGIRLTPIIGTLSIWSLFFAGLAWRQRHQFSKTERFGLDWETFKEWVAKSRRPRDFATVAISVIVIVAAISAIVWRVQDPSGDRTFTEFYLLGEGGMLHDYSTELKVGKPQNFTIGIANYEQETTIYSVGAYLEDKQVGTLRERTLEYGEEWEGQITVTPSQESDQGKLEMKLYRGTNQEEYHNVYLFVTVSSP